MKKTFLFIFSFLIAIGITYYSKDRTTRDIYLKSSEWKTYLKKSDSIVTNYPTTSEEFKAAKIPINPKTKENDLSNDREPASINQLKGVLVRDGRILMGEVDQKYEDEDLELEMINSYNPKWKEIMGYELIRFHDENTKLIVKEEMPLLKISQGRGRYLEQVIITYLKANGDRNSFKALVDSETGNIVETWDRSIQEKRRKSRRGTIALPSITENGITTK